jgi:hypothetical protein
MAGRGNLRCAVVLLPEGLKETTSGGSLKGDVAPYCSVSELINFDVVFLSWKIAVGCRKHNIP